MAKTRLEYWNFGFGFPKLARYFSGFGRRHKVACVFPFFSNPNDLDTRILLTFCSEIPFVFSLFNSSARLSSLSNSSHSFGYPPGSCLFVIKRRRFCQNLGRYCEKKAKQADWHKLDYRGLGQFEIPTAEHYSRNLYDSKARKLRASQWAAGAMVARCSPNLFFWISKGCGFESHVARFLSICGLIPSNIFV
jgi:hypothetical protein